MVTITKTFNNKKHLRCDSSVVLFAVTFAVSIGWKKKKKELSLIFRIDFNTHSDSSVYCTTCWSVHSHLVTFRFVDDLLFQHCSWPYSRFPIGIWKRWIKIALCGKVSFQFPSFSTFLFSLFFSCVCSNLCSSLSANAVFRSSASSAALAAATLRQNCICETLSEEWTGKPIIIFLKN